MHIREGQTVKIRVPNESGILHNLGRGLHKVTIERELVSREMYDVVTNVNGKTIKATALISDFASLPSN